MKIAYYMPFKPLDHSNPSGDLVIGTELYHHLADRGHEISLVSKLRLRWIYYHPVTFLRLLSEKNKIVRKYRPATPDLWLSYHCYYKAPDLLGSYCSRKLAVPYIIFQGIYSTKRRRKLKTFPGFFLNRRVLLSADHIFTNKKRDLINLQRLLPDERVSYIAPGVHPGQFRFSEVQRNQLRATWGITNETVIMSTAMMRPGVKCQGIGAVIASCGELIRNDLPLKLIIAGDGSGRPQLEQQAAKLPTGSVSFLGKIPRMELYRYYSAADIFAFPGIDESLGMVYLEAQSCNLPVVAYGDWGGGEAVVDGETGLLSAAAEPSKFTANIQCLAENETQRRRLAIQAGNHIRRHHDLEINYDLLELKMINLAKRVPRAT